MSLSTSIYLPITEDSRLSNYVLKSDFQNRFFTNNLTSTNVNCNNILTSATIGSNESLPTFVNGNGTALGTGGSVSVSSGSNNLYGTIILNSGLTPSSAGNIITTLTTTTSFSSTSSFIICCSSSSSNNTYRFYGQPSATNKWILYCSSTLPASTSNIQVNYLIFGK